MIEVKNLVKNYGDHTAVDGLSFTIDKGKIYGFLGPNGAGKSTTLNIITGYLAATSGEVFMNGIGIMEEPEKFKRSIGYLPEQPPVYMDMTVREYLRFAAELKGIKKNSDIQAKVVMGRVKLNDVADRLIGNLSKGYRQRVGLGQAILGFPETIILDEPMVGMDPLQIIEIRELIRSLAKNHTVMLSSHILAEVRELCDYILIISKGKLVAQDTPENLEKLLSGDDKLILEVKCSVEEITAALETISGIEDVKLTRLDPDLLRAVIAPKASTVIRHLCETLFYTFSEKKLPIITMYEDTGSLEEVYLKLTQEGGASAENHIQ